MAACADAGITARHRPQTLDGGLSVAQEQKHHAVVELFKPYLFSVMEAANDATMAEVASKYGGAFLLCTAARAGRAALVRSLIRHAGVGVDAIDETSGCSALNGKRSFALINS